MSDLYDQDAESAAEAQLVAEAQDWLDGQWWLPTSAEHDPAATREAYDDAWFDRLDTVNQAPRAVPDPRPRFDAGAWAGLIVLGTGAIVGCGLWALAVWGAQTAWGGSVADLTFAQVSEVNARRCARWHPPESEPWSGADWSNAMCGEAGEAANVVKKLRRVETGVAPNPHGLIDVEMTAPLLRDLADELADTYLYLDLLARHYGIDLPAAIIRKFNAVSERQGFPERLS